MRRFSTLVVLVAATLAPAIAAAAELKPETVHAWNAYVAAARRAFVSRPRHIESVAGVPETVTGAAAHGDGITEIPGGLVHHWIGRAFLPGVTLDQALAVSRAYASYDKTYESVIRSRLLDRQGDTFHVLMRLKEGGAGVTAVLDVRSTVIYSHPAPGTVVTISHADEIREVQNAGEPDERLLPAGHDSGYLWRATTFTYLSERPDGLYVEMETLGLSRTFPSLLGWIIEPIARRVGRKSVEGSLQEFIAAVKQRPDAQTRLSDR
jgi:hypothetical protein